MARLAKLKRLRLDVAGASVPAAAKIIEQQVKQLEKGLHAGGSSERQQASIYLMDEPFAGVDAKTETMLVDILHGLRDAGNTLLVVEHEESIIRAADHLVDIGPGRGEHGGDLVYGVQLEWLYISVMGSQTVD